MRGIHMLRKNSFSLVVMLVLNPIIILFFQNCSVLPATPINGTPIQKNSSASPATSMTPGSHFWNRAMAGSTNSLEEDTAKVQDLNAGSCRFLQYRCAE